MPKQEQDLKILYIQIREDLPTREEEFGEFSRFSGLDKSQFTVINVFDTSNFDTEVIKDHDALFIGGSSDATGLESVAHPEKYPYANCLRDLFVYCIDNNIPVFASCYGFEEVVVAAGGTLVKDERNVGAGFANIQLTEEGKQDPLFKDSPEKFNGASWHSERAQTVPDNFVVLAKTGTCPYAAIKIKNKPFYGFQFYLEIDKQGLVNRLERYIERYQSSEVEETLQKIRENCPPVPESNALVKKFVERILLT